MGRPAPLPPSEDRPDLRATRDPLRTRQPPSPSSWMGRRRHLAPAYCFLPTTTTRRFRPCLRRRFRILRPAFVAIRARNPCLFFRFRLCGRYVGIPMARLRRLKSWPAKIRNVSDTTGSGQPGGIREAEDRSAENPTAENQEAETEMRKTQQRRIRKRKPKCGKPNSGESGSGKPDSGKPNGGRGRGGR
jgi:hypothetical protein